MIRAWEAIDMVGIALHGRKDAAAGNLQDRRIREAAAGVADTDVARAMIVNSGAGPGDGQLRAIGRIIVADE